MKFGEQGRVTAKAARELGLAEGTPEALWGNFGTYGKRRGQGLQQEEVFPRDVRCTL